MLPQSSQNKQSTKFSLITLLALTVFALSFQTGYSETTGSDKDISANQKDESTTSNENKETSLKASEETEEETDSAAAEKKQTDLTPDKPASTESKTETKPKKKKEPYTGPPKTVYVIPIDGVISKPNYYILRRGFKEAMAEDVDTIVLDINTPGGRLDYCIEIMEAIGKFDGTVIAYVNNEAISAGAYISIVSEEIYFVPSGTMGSAAVISATGEDIQETMKQKIDSYMRGKVRAMVKEHRYRADVMRAMMDSKFEFKIGDEVISPKDDLLLLTAEEAVKEYGDPPEKLLADGIAESVDDLLDQKFGEANHKQVKLEITWSEKLAQFLDPFLPILIGLGFLAIVAEFYSPGFGVAGISGVCLLLTGFALNHVVGLAGHEPILFFILGIILIAVEVLILPGTILPGFLGLCLMFGSLIWSMADIWPKTEDGQSFDFAVFAEPIFDMSIACGVTIVGAVILWRFLPHTSIYSKLILNTQLSNPDPVIAGGGSASTGDSPSKLPNLGTLGKAITDIHPGGEVEIDGYHFQAVTELDSIPRGTQIKVVGYKNFALLVARNAS